MVRKTIKRDSAAGTGRSTAAALQALAGPADALLSLGAVNARDYGCVGDGITDDTTSMQSALTAAAGGILYIPPGVYSLSAQLVLDAAAVSIVGAGAGVTELRWTAAAPSRGVSIRPNHASQMVLVRGLRFVTASNTTSSIALAIDVSAQIVATFTQDRYQKRAIVEQCVFAGADAIDRASPFSDGWGVAIYCVACIDVAVVDCTIIGPGAGFPAHAIARYNGILFVGSPATGSFDNGHPVVCFVERTYVQFTDTAINFYNAEGCVVSHCNLVGANTGVYGLSEPDIHPLLDIHDTHLNCYVHGVLVQGMLQVNIHDNWIYTLAGGDGADGVNIQDGARNVSVCNNVFKPFGSSDTQNGCIIAADYGVVSGNIFVQNFGAMYTALWLTAASRNLVGANNIFNGTFNNTLLDQGTGNAVS